MPGRPHLAGVRKRHSIIKLSGHQFQKKALADPEGQMKGRLCANVPAQGVKILEGA